MEDFARLKREANSMALWVVSIVAPNAISTIFWMTPGEVKVIAEPHKQERVMKRPITTQYMKGKKALRVGRSGTVQNAIIAAFKHMVLGTANNAEIYNGHGVMKATVRVEGRYITVLKL